MLTLYCSRPHVREVDFETSRFIVSQVIGLEVDGQHLEMGQEVPRGVLSAETLRCLYDTPTRRIETIEYAFNDEDLKATAMRQGVVFKTDDPTPPGSPGSPSQGIDDNPSTSPNDPPDSDNPSQEKESPTVSTDHGLNHDLDSLSFNELKKLCAEKGVSNAGNIGQLRRRLRTLLG